MIHRNGIVVINFGDGTQSYEVDDGVHDCLLSANKAYVDDLCQKCPRELHMGDQEGHDGA